MTVSNNTWVGPLGVYVESKKEQVQLLSRTLSFTCRMCIYYIQPRSIVDHKFSVHPWVLTHSFHYLMDRITIVSNMQHRKRTQFQTWSLRETTLSSLCYTEGDQQPNTKRSAIRFVFVSLTCVPKPTNTFSFTYDVQVEVFNLMLNCLNLLTYHILCTLDNMPRMSTQDLFNYILFSCVLFKTLCM